MYNYLYIYTPVFEVVEDIHQHVIDWDGQLTHSMACTKVGQVAHTAKVKHRRLMQPNSG